MKIEARTYERFITEYLEPIREGKYPAPCGIGITWEMFCLICEQASRNIKKYGWASYKSYIDQWYTRVYDASTRK